MAVGARVESLEALAAFRVAMVKFQEAAGTALGDSESDVHGTIRWLENDQTSYWSTQIRHRTEALVRAQEALRQKQIFKDSSGRVPSVVEEQKIVTKCKMLLDEAQQKLAATKSWAKRLQKEMLLYKGAMGRFQNCLTSDVPSAIGHIGLLITTLQEYFAMQERGEQATIDPALAAYFGAEAGGVATMSRGQAPQSTQEEPAKEGDVKEADQEKKPDEAKPPV